MPMFRQIHVEHLIMQYIGKIKADRNRIIKNKSELTKERMNQAREIEKLKRELNKIHSRIKKWQYAFAEDLISAEDLKKRMAEETEEEQIVSKQLESLLNIQKPVDAYNEVIDLLDMWETLDDLDKNEAITTIFKSITLNTDYVYSHSNRHKRNEFFPASIDVIYN